MRGTADILEDLAVLGVLDDKIAVGSMNRGGLRDAAFEMDDRYTGYDVESIIRSNLDFAKVLIRINLGDAASARTLEETARAVSQAAAAQLQLAGAHVGSASASTLSPTDRATAGLTTSSITLFMCRVSVQNFSSPKVE